ncbi:MAG: AAA family ATPase [Aphanothece sp. CMT-3BRIN-NPC111]|jgi:predicted ATP-dependent endonuclease of OLD family|nr:AAA family ATPase [Aphanothece sp. CMT-3BRIN-NPC111]
MHLQRIQVPDFRVLKDVDIVFEKNFSPRIFPLGSQNGGGKSTLLQLIFVLLHCAFAPDRLAALKNILKYFHLKGSSSKSLAIINILHEGREIELEFFGCPDSYIEQLIIEESVSKEHDSNDNIGSKLKFSMIPELENIRKNVSGLAKDRIELENIISGLEDIKNFVTPENRSRFTELSHRLEQFTKFNKYRETGKTDMTLILTMQAQATKQLNKLKETYDRINSELVTLSFSINRITSFLNSKNLIYICNYSSDSDSSDNQALVCQVSNLGPKEISPFLESLSNKVFLAAPSTQVFLFLSRETNKLLFKKQDSYAFSNNYYSLLKEARSGIPGLFTYDFLEVDILIDAFKAARDKDFKEAIETGEYGNAYKALLNDLNSLLANKQINLSPNLSEITFKPLINDGNVEFYPEDLSHGELKRLSIYMWLKYRNVEDAIVLMDEIEIALHPDWQYRIVLDLLQWAPTNQYILATHSYELCQALTPAHVKELEPKLLKQSEQPV